MGGLAAAHQHACNERYAHMSVRSAARSDHANPTHHRAPHIAVVTAVPHVAAAAPDMAGEGMPGEIVPGVRMAGEVQVPVAEVTRHPDVPRVTHDRAMMAGVDRSTHAVAPR